MWVVYRANVELIYFDNRISMDAERRRLSSARTLCDAGNARSRAVGDIIFSFVIAAPYLTVAFRRSESTRSWSDADEAR